MRVGATPRHVVTESGAPSEASEVRSRFDSPLFILAIGGVLALGVVLRFVCQSDLWADEVLSVNIAKLPISQISAALRHDGSPPLYYLLLHVWMRIFGTGDAAVRALSGLAGVIALVPMWFVGRRIDERRIRLRVAPAGSRTVAWSALLLLAMSPFAIRYSTEARMYSLVILWVLLGYLAVARAFERPTIARLVPVSVVTSLLLYTHYWTFSLVGVTGLTMLVYAWRGAPERRRAAAAATVAVGVGVLTFLPWWSSFSFQLAHTGTPWGAPAGPASNGHPRRSRPGSAGRDP